MRVPQKLSPAALTLAHSDSPENRARRVLRSGTGTDSLALGRFTHAGPSVELASVDVTARIEVVAVPLKPVTTAQALAPASGPNAASATMTPPRRIVVPDSFMTGLRSPPSADLSARAVTRGSGDVALKPKSLDARRRVPRRNLGPDSLPKGRRVSPAAIP